MTQRLLITPGEPAGIGPDITVQIAQQSWSAELVVVADPDCLRQRANQLGLPLTLIECQIADAPTAHIPGTLKIIPVTLNAPAQAGVLNVANAPYVMQTLDIAARLCEEKKADAIVTGPVNKEILNRAGIAFAGHTEFFAQHANVPATVMLFVVDNLKVALATTHLPLSKVSSAITEKRLQTVITVLAEGLTRRLGVASPRIYICGLNPHAGEGGYLGREEIDVITPALTKLRQQGYSLIGPLPADTIFTSAHLQQADAVLAMYHDQALPLIKYLGFDRAVNVTLGLPYLRTSVDHGTAIDIAGTGLANAGSLAAALALAIQHG